MIMHRGGAGGEFTVAPALLAAQRAELAPRREGRGARYASDRPGRCRVPSASSAVHRRHAAPRLQIGGRHPQFARDPAEIGGVHLAHFPELAPVLQPVAGVNQQGPSHGSCADGKLTEVEPKTSCCSVATPRLRPYYFWLQLAPNRTSAGWNPNTCQLCEADTQLRHRQNFNHFFCSGPIRRSISSFPDIRSVNLIKFP